MFRPVLPLAILVTVALNGFPAAALGANPSELRPTVSPGSHQLTGERVAWLIRTVGVPGLVLIGAGSVLGVIEYMAPVRGAALVEAPGAPVEGAH